MKVFFQTFLYLNVGVSALFFGIWLWTAFPFSIGAQADERDKPLGSANSLVATPAPKPNSDTAPKSANSLATAPAPASASATAPKPNPDTAPKSANSLAPAPASASATAPKPNPDTATAPAPTPHSASSTKTPGSVPPIDSPMDSSPSSATDLSNKMGQNNKDKDTGSIDQISNQAPPVSDNNIDLAPEAQANRAPNSVNNESQDLAPEAQANRAPNSDNLPVPPPPSISEKKPSTTSEELKTQIQSAQKMSEQKGKVSAETANELMNVNQKVVEIYEMLSNYEYDPSDKRDPFIPFRPKTMATQEEVEVFNHATSDYALNEIKLIGLKWGKGPGLSKAMFKTPDNEIHYLQAKDRIGSDGAIIDRLGEDKVVVLEPRFALESQSRTSGGSERVFVPKIIYLSRFASEIEDKNKDSAQTASVSSPRVATPKRTHVKNQKKKDLTRAPSSLNQSAMTKNSQLIQKVRKKVALTTRQ